MNGSQDQAWLTPATADADGLPHPVTERWQPLRLGLVDLFYYDDEQFWFHDGRLLLRGNNGTGKSKVLALTLPFLLDGSVLPRRVEPDADPKKRMEWNLLLGGAHSSTERTGYSWVEFGRRDADGVEHFTTLGIGLKAAAGRGIVKTWFFTTTLRIGELRLMDRTRTVLSDSRLREALGSDGQLHTTQAAYRRAVDEALFRLGEERYAALVDLLIQLRQPQLSKNPDERALSAALTEALAPLDQAVVADVAESFRSLEEEREGVAAARETLKGAEEFLKHYRVYAKVAARRHTTSVRTANSAFEHAGRNLREAEERSEAARTEVARLAAEQAGAEQRQAELQGQQQALRESPEMREAQQLHLAERTAAEMERRAASAEAEAEKARGTARREAEAETEAGARLQWATEMAERSDAEAAALAAAAGLADEHERALADPDLARRALTRRRDQIAHIRTFAESVRAVRERAAQLRTALDGAETAEAGRAEDVRAAEAGVLGAVAAHRDQIHGYLAALAALEVEAGSLAEQVEEWARRLAGESPARTAVRTAAATALAEWGRRRVAAEHEATQLGERLAEIGERIANLESGHDPEPPTAPGRDRSLRSGRAGAPLWRVADFASDVADADRAGVEAALQSAGMIDAWIHPDGSVDAAGDVVLGPLGSELSASLTSLLTPAVGPDLDVPSDVVAGVLARIGLGESSGAALWVDASGAWGAGPARGAWSKPRAEYVGAGARETHRRELLATLRAEHEVLASELSTAQDRVARAEASLASVQAERDAYPEQSERDLVTAHERAAAAERELTRAQEAVALAHEAWEQAAQSAERRAAELAEAAMDLGVGVEAAELDAATVAVSDYGTALAEARNAVRSLVEAETAAERAAERAAEASEILEHREGEAHELRTRAGELRARFEALEETVGASVAELQERLGAISVALEEVTARLRSLARDERTAFGEQSRLEEKVAELGRRREETAAEREREIGALRTFAATGVLRVALPDLEVPGPAAYDAWNLTAALALSRTAEQSLDGTDESDEAWSRAQQRVSSAHTELTGKMSRHGHTAVLEQHGEVMVVRVRYRAEEIDVDRLAGRLADDIDARERLLSAREREILENHLVSEVAGHLHELLLSAESQIDRMNRELASRKTSTGMQLRVLWRERSDGPSGLADARQLMIRSDATWTPADRAAIGDFLQARIAEVRQADPTSGWQEHLEAALDYRQWHSFMVERWQNGQWRSASGPASGGEKVLAVSVPLFAAASAHYNSAGPLAPRLILLDEAFAGVDDDSRAKSLGLLATFDMDVVMTSEREWGCYPQVPGLAIAQLSRVEGVDAVGITRWRWDGRRRERIEEVAEEARAGRGPEPTPEGSLFG